MRTAIIIAAGLVIAAVFIFAGRLFGRGPESMVLGAKIFIPLWFIAAVFVGKEDHYRTNRTICQANLDVD